MKKVERFCKPDQMSFFLAKIGSGFHLDGYFHLASPRVASELGPVLALPLCVCPERFQNSCGFPQQALLHAGWMPDQSIPPCTSVLVSGWQRNANLGFSCGFSFGGYPLSENRIAPSAIFIGPPKVGRAGNALCSRHILKLTPGNGTGTVGRTYSSVSCLP